MGLAASTSADHSPRWEARPITVWPTSSAPVPSIPSGGPEPTTPCGPWSSPVPRSTQAVHSPLSPRVREPPRAVHDSQRSPPQARCWHGRRTSATPSRRSLSVVTPSMSEGPSRPPGPRPAAQPRAGATSPLSTQPVSEPFAPGHPLLMVLSMPWCSRGRRSMSAVPSRRSPSWGVLRPPEDVLLRSPPTVRECSEPGRPQWTVRSPHWRSTPPPCTSVVPSRP